MRHLSHQVGSTLGYKRGDSAPSSFVTGVSLPPPKTLEILFTSCWSISPKDCSTLLLSDSRSILGGLQPQHPPCSARAVQRSFCSALVNGLEERTLAAFAELALASSGRATPGDENDAVSKWYRIIVMKYSTMVSCAAIERQGEEGPRLKVLLSTVDA